MQKWLLRIFGWLIVLAIAFGLGGLAMRYYYEAQRPQVEEEATVLLERIRKVAKLITVEGEFSEIYTYKDYLYFDISPLRKKALLRVNAKVSMGYDLSNMKIEADPDTRTFYISQLPDPEILSIDHDLSYYDLQEGVFNYFDPKGQTRMVEQAKKNVRDKALESDLYQTAVEQGLELQELIEFLAASAGWEVRYLNRYEEVELPGVTVE